MKWFIALILVSALAACSQSSLVNSGPSATVTPLAFGTTKAESAEAIARHSAGVYAAGNTDGNLHSTQRGNGDGFLRKYDTAGKLLWGVQFGSTQNDVVWGVATDASNNAYVVGSTDGTLTSAPATSNGAAFVRKYAPNGAVLWTKQFSSKDTDYPALSATSVAVVGSNVYLVGQYVNYEFQMSYGYLKKFSSSGAELWTRTISGGGYETSANDVAVDGNGNAYVAGGTDGSIGGGYGMYLRKYTPSGSVSWSRRRSYTTSDIESANAVTVYGSSVYLAGDYFDETYFDRDVRVLKYNTSGSMLWDRRFRTADSDHASDISASNQGVVFIGFSDGPLAGSERGRSDAYVYKLNVSGTKLWSRQVGTAVDDYANAVLNTDVSVYVAGSTEGKLGSANRGGQDAFLARFNPTDGATLWIDQ